jgi:hypothetical protein
MPLKVKVSMYLSGIHTSYHHHHTFCHAAEGNAAVTLAPVWITGAMTMTETPPNCKGTNQGSKAFIGLQNTDNTLTTFYQYDRRLDLVGNTLQSPASVNADENVNANFGGIMRDEVCPVVPRTFLNEESCVRKGGSICGTKSFERGTTFVTLDGQTFADWYTNDKKHVHAIRGLRLEKYEDGNTNDPMQTWIPPCLPGATTRWVRSEISGGCPSTAPWNSATSATIAAALMDGSKTADTSNDVVRDVVVRELKYELIKVDTECDASDHRLSSGGADSVEECARMCLNYVHAEHGDCVHFLYGKGMRVGYCYMEFVTADDCGAGGYEVDTNYDFYKLDKAYNEDVAGTCNMAPVDDFVGASVEVNVDTGIDDGAGTGATVINVECWQHSHPEEYNIYDFSRWVGMHPGNEDATENGRRNPIARFAEETLAELWFPTWHIMSRWNERDESWELQSNIVSVVSKGGGYAYSDDTSHVKFGDAIDIADLAPSLLTDGLVAKAGAVYEYLDQVVGFEACGSRGEVANEPGLGNKFYNVNDDFGTTQGVDQSQYRYEAGKAMTWATVVLNAPDQLRQRTAWALSQVFTTGVPNFGYEDDTEIWLNYYDIFVDNAFGNFRDIVREVAASPLMGEYLTFKGNSAFASNGGKFPDENFARELMHGARFV